MCVLLLFEIKMIKEDFTYKMLFGQRLKEDQIENEASDTWAPDRKVKAKVWRLEHA